MHRRLAVPVLIFLGGCYGYYPTTGPAPRGRDVEVTLSDSGAVALSRQIGPSAEAVRGRFATDSDNTLVLAVTGVRQRDGNDVDWKGERLAIPRLLVVNVQERRFSRARTMLLGGAVLIGSVALRQAFSGSGFSFFGNGQSGKSGPK
jgi:hypothetical protein